MPVNPSPPTNKGFSPFSRSIDITLDDALKESESMGDTAPFTDPMSGIRAWLDEAASSEVNDPNAMALATVDNDGVPDVRMVLLKAISPRGFEFYTNANSAKGVQLMANPHAAAVLHWKSLRRQVRLRGEIERISSEEADAYFASRPRGSRIAAVASSQSQPVDSYEDLLYRFREIEQQCSETDVKRPEHWQGYLIVPHTIELWINNEYRMHRRWQFRRSTPSALWTINQLQP